MSANSWDKFRRFLGQHQRTLGVVLDRREAAEQALDLSERQFRILVESVTDCAIYMLDANGHVTSWNAGAQQIKGYSADEILGLIQLLNREYGKTVVMVTHDARAAEYSLHQLYVDKGQLFANGRGVPA